MKYAGGLTVMSLLAVVLLSACLDSTGGVKEGDTGEDPTRKIISTTRTLVSTTIDGQGSQAHIDSLKTTLPTTSTTTQAIVNPETLPDGPPVSTPTTSTQDMFLEHQLEYDFIITRLYSIDGKLTYQAHRKGFDLIRYGTHEFEADYPVEVNGKLAYVLDRGDKKIVIHNFKEGRLYDTVSEPRELNGKLFYYATLDGKNIWVYGNREFSSESGLAEHLREETGKSVSLFSGEFIIHEGPEVSLGTHTLTPSIINGKLAYNLVGTDGKRVIIYNGQSYGEEYDVTSWPVEVDGKLAYIAQIGNNALVSLNEYLVVYDGVGQKRYGYVSDLCEINDKPTYIAKLGGKSFVVHDGIEGKRYDYIDSITSAAGKLVYRAREGEKYIIVYGDVEISEYDYVQDPVEVDGKLVFYARLNDKKYIAIER